MRNRAVIGYRVGQAANWAYDYLMKNGPIRPDGTKGDFAEELQIRTEMYIKVLDNLESYYGKDDWKPFVRAKDIPVIVDIEDEPDTMDTITD